MGGWSLNCRKKAQSVVLAFCEFEPEAISASSVLPLRGLSRLDGTPGQIFGIVKPKGWLDFEFYLTMCLRRRYRP